MAASQGARLCVGSPEGAAAVRVQGEGRSRGLLPHQMSCAAPYAPPGRRVLFVAQVLDIAPERARFGQRLEAPAPAAKSASGLRRRVVCGHGQPVGPGTVALGEFERLAGSCLHEQVCTFSPAIAASRHRPGQGNPRLARRVLRIHASLDECPEGTRPSRRVRRVHFGQIQSELRRVELGA